MMTWGTQHWKRHVKADADLAQVGTGIVAGTKVATPIGWRPVEAIAVGDSVLTFDGGMRPVLSVSRNVVWTSHDTDVCDWPLQVPAAALGNREPMQLLPGQAVMIESDAAEDLFGDPFALIPAAALDGFRGITPVAPPARIEVVTLVFAQDEIVFANVGALFHCPAATDLVAAAYANSPYTVLSMDDADLLVDCLDCEAARPVNRPVAATAQHAAA